MPTFNQSAQGSAGRAPVSLFISYSHADESALERLHKHLTMLQRQEVIDTWTDHRIKGGDRLDNSISAALDDAQIFVALVSPDYLASRYCYEKEFGRAQELAASGRLRIVPVIVEPCEWLKSPLSQLMALPKDGKPISEWTNANNAYLDVVTRLRSIVESMGVGSPELADSSQTPSGRPPRQPRIKQHFDAIQKDDYIDQAFATIRNYFESSCRELTDAGDGRLKAKFESMNVTAFTCTVVNRTLRSGGEAHITVRNGKGRRSSGDITYVDQRYADDGSSNGSIRVEADDYSLYLVMDSYGFSSGGEKNKRTPEQVATELWDHFCERAGIKYGDDGE